MTMRPASDPPMSRCPAAEATATTTTGSLAKGARLLETIVVARRSVALAVMVVLAGCTPASSASVTRGLAALRPTCGPADEPGVLLEVPVSAAAFPQFRLRVNGTATGLVGHSYTVRGAEGETAFADWCGDASDCRPVPGAVTTAAFGPMTADTSMAVRVRSTAPGGEPFAWSGVAVWHGQTMMCG
jgi:hypothetical protein